MSRNINTRRPTRRPSSRRGTPVGKPLRPKRSYELKNKPLNTKSTRLMPNSKREKMQKTIFFLIICALAAILVYVVITKTKSCSTDRFKENQDTSEIEKLIEPGTSTALSQELKEKLKENKKYEWIAAHTSSYDDPKIIELALREPSALDFVYKWPKAEKIAHTYDEGVIKGSAPKLYCWDERWGYVNYGGLPLAITGSGPTTMSMAYMATVGKCDKTPATMAKIATDAGCVSESGETSPEFFTTQGAKIGVTCKEVDLSSNTATNALSQRHLVIAHMNKAPKDIGPHWILIADHQRNGLVTVYDPSSTKISNTQWDAETILKKCDLMYEVLPKE